MKCDKISKVHNLPLIQDVNFYLLEILLYFLVNSNVAYIKTVMKTHSYRNCLLTLSSQVVRKDHTNLNKPEPKSC